ncbi:hypothetical protein [Coxiella burnetii]|uniref:Uncharacterized protein n=1 Tax=Coxiella burnetii (strain RSA 493 / Nine Mile phase I) TaxID=227377 RepID=B5QSA3_COXBU|nr:hypothetical protein [Coxiella burnetii]YP_002332976.1 hypothetical protein CBU_0777c [Coxiella burnetii RSA 493]ACI15267.1 hypothetical protein CBU_0777c [Coxiella burnetii RSA 493]ARI65615.1 hypothetical protein B7L74_03960 [Coxiella burnetii]ARK27093.1 hypothetical protein BMW92_03845 [Coxiella burnetii]MCF2093692.1 hypothetical protein [Coxiella burnetii]MCF2094808.1 hypothetical protein [Coxiella burnetii]
MIVFYFILFAAVVYLLLPVGGVRSNKIASLLLICNAFSFLVALILALFAFITPIAANYTSQDSVYRCIALINFSVFFVLSIVAQVGGHFLEKKSLKIPAVILRGTPFIPLAIALVFFEKLTHLTHNLLSSWF